MAVGNTGSRLVGNTEFYGGLSTDNKIGIENSYADGECLDVRKSPSQMTVLPMSRKLNDGNVISGLMTAMTQSKDGNIWGVDENGKLYKIDSNNNVSILNSGDAITYESESITGVSYSGSSLEGSGTMTFVYSESDSGWGVGDEPEDYYSAEQMESKFGITYEGEPDDEDTITVDYDMSTSSGFSLEYFGLDDGLWYADGGHKLFSYGNVLNPMGTDESIYSFEYLKDDSEYLVSAINIKYGEGVQYYYESDNSIIRSEGEEECSVPTSIDETIVEGTELTSKLRQYAGLFLPACTPIVRVGIGFIEKGEGTVKLVIHDERDNVVASSNEIDADDVSVSGYTLFEVRPNPNDDASASNQLCPVPWAGDTLEAGSVYHIHILASSDGYKVRTSVDGDMSLTLDFAAYAFILHDTFNHKHPMVMFDKLYIGNGRYVSTKGSSPLDYLDDTIFIQDALRIDDGYEVCCFGSSDEYLMIGAEKYSVGSTRGFQAGRIYFWDRQTDAPSFYVDCTMGAPKCIFNLGNIVYIVIAGALYAYTGGKELVKVRMLSGTDTEYTGRTSITEVNPNMMAVRREVLVIGFPSQTSAYKIRHGIYAFGSVDKNYPNCFTYNYKIPAETVSETLSQYNSDTQKLRIGCVYNFNDTLFYSYEAKITSTPVPTEENPNPTPVTTTNVGLALVDNESGTSTSFVWKSLQYDAGAPYLEKMALRIGVYFDPLPNATTITPIYRIDNGDWETGTVTAESGDRCVHLEINKRFHELQYGFIGTTGNDTLTPVIKQVSAEVRVLNEEAKL